MTNPNVSEAGDGILPKDGAAVQENSNGNLAPPREATPAEAQKLIDEAKAKEAAAAADKSKQKTPEQLAKEKADADAAAAEKAKTTDDEEDDWDGEYVALDHPSGDAAIEVMKEAGMSAIEASAVFADALKTGDITKVKWNLLEAKIGKAKTQLVKDGITQYNTEVISKTQATRATVLETVGGEDNWQAITKWAKAREKTDKVFAGQLQEYRKAIEIGGGIAKHTAEVLKAEFNKDPKNNGLGVTAIIQGGALPASVDNPLTRADYVVELKKAHDRRASPEEIKALDARRTAGRQKGI